MPSQDEKNSLDDLSNECQKALAQVESEPIQKAISTSENILATAELSPSHTQQFKQCHGRLQELAGVAKELTGIQKGLAEVGQLFMCVEQQDCSKCSIYSPLEYSVNLSTCSA